MVSYAGGAVEEEEVVVGMELALAAAAKEEEEEAVVVVEAVWDKNSEVESSREKTRILNWRMRQVNERRDPRNSQTSVP